MKKCYLTEKSLVEFLKEHVDTSGNHNKKFLSYRFRPDYVSHKFKIAVEFDGYLHYTKSKTILDDYAKDTAYSKEGYEIIRIPYFVQLDSKVMSSLFSNYVSESFNYIEYPHGFIDEKAVLPADFCSLGVRRFKNDLMKFSYIKKEIMNSLSKIEKRKHEVYPLYIKKAEPKPRQVSSG